MKEQTQYRNNAFVSHKSTYNGV